MPLEISEIGVRLTVADPQRASSPDDPPSDGSGAVTPEQEDRMVAACVAEVLRVLRMREER